MTPELRRGEARFGRAGGRQGQLLRRSRARGGAQQREEGWAAEAAEKAQQLRAAMALRSASAQAITEAGRAMVDRTGPPLTATDCERQPGLTRVYFHDALRSAATGDEALALLPLARCLDLAAGHGLAERELRRVASLDFRARGPLAFAYRDLVLRRAADGGAALLRRLEGGPRWAHDLRLGALVVAGQVASSLEEVRALITDTADPWFTLMLPAYDAERQLAAGASDRAEHTLRVALAGCDERRWAYRCAHLADRLQKLYGEQGRYADHELQVEAAVRLFRAAGHSQAEDNALAALAKARHLRGRMALAAATFQEARSRLADKYCSGARFATAGLAELSVYQRATLDDLQISPDACGDAPSAIELATVVDLARMSGDDDDRATAKTWIAADYPRTGFGRSTITHGWGCMFRGAGHDRLASRRWLDFGPWRVLRRPDDTTFIQFHDLAITDPAEAYEQAKAGHARMGISPTGGYIAWHMQGLLKGAGQGLYTASERLLEVVVGPGNTVTQAEMLCNAALRLHHRSAPTSTPVERVAYVFVNEPDARAHLHELWLRELECWVVDDKGKRRLDLDYHPVPDPPAWVKRLDGR